MLPDALEDSLETDLPPWIDVNMTWSVPVWHDADYDARQTALTEAMTAAEVAWAAAHPDLAACTKLLDDVDDVDEVLDQLGLWCSSCWPRRAIARCAFGSSATPSQVASRADAAPTA